MLYRLWEDGKVGSLDDPLEKYVDNFTIKNPLGKSRDSELKYVTDGLIFLDSGEVQIRSSSVTLRRMASQLSGKFPASNLVSRSNSMVAQESWNNECLITAFNTHSRRSKWMFLWTQWWAHVWPQLLVVNMGQFSRTNSRAQNWVSFIAVSQKWK